MAANLSGNLSTQEKAAIIDRLRSSVKYLYAQPDKSGYASSRLFHNITVGGGNADEAVIPAEIKKVLDGEIQVALTTIETAWKTQDKTLFMSHNRKHIYPLVKTSAEKIFLNEAGQVKQEYIDALAHQLKDGKTLASSDDVSKRLFSGRASLKDSLLGSYINCCLHYVTERVDQATLRLAMNKEGELYPLFLDFVNVWKHLWNHAVPLGAIDFKPPSESDAEQYSDDDFRFAVAPSDWPDNDAGLEMGSSEQPKLKTPVRRRIRWEPKAFSTSNLPAYAEETNAAASISSSIQFRSFKKPSIGQSRIASENSENPVGIVKSENKENSESNTEPPKGVAGVKKKRNRRSNLEFLPSDFVQGNGATKDDQKEAKSTVAHLPEINPNVGVLESDPDQSRKAYQRPFPAALECFDENAKQLIENKLKATHEESERNLLIERQEAIKERIAKLKRASRDLTAAERKQLPLQLCHDALWLEDKKDNPEALFFDIAINNLERKRYATEELKATQEYQFFQNLKKLKERISESHSRQDGDLYQTLRKFDAVVQKANFSEEDKEKAYEVANNQINKVLGLKVVQIDRAGFDEAFDKDCQFLSYQIQVDEKVSNILVGAGVGVAGTATGVGCILWGVAGILASCTSVFATVGISLPIALFGIGWSIASIVTGVGILMGVAAAEKAVTKRYEQTNKAQQEWNSVCSELEEKANAAANAQPAPQRERGVLPIGIYNLQRISVDDIAIPGIDSDSFAKGKAYLALTMENCIARDYANSARARAFQEPGMKIGDFPLQLQMKAREDFVNLYNQAVDFYLDSKHFNLFRADNSDYIIELCTLKKGQGQPTLEVLKHRHQDLFEKIYHYIFDEKGNYTEIFVGEFTQHKITIDAYLARCGLSKEDLFLQYVQLYQNIVRTFSHVCKAEANTSEFRMLFTQFHTEFFGRDQASGLNSQACRAFFQEKCAFMEEKRLAERKEDDVNPKMKEAEEAAIILKNTPEQSRSTSAKSGSPSSSSSVRDDTEVCHVEPGRKYLETVIQNYEPHSDKKSKRLFADPGMSIEGFSAELRKKAMIDCERIYTAALCSGGKPENPNREPPLDETELIRELSKFQAELFEEIYQYIFNEKGGYTEVFKGKFSADQLSVDEFLKKCGKNRAFLFEQYVLLYNQVVAQQLQQRFVSFPEEISELDWKEDMLGYEYVQVHARFFGVELPSNLNEKACQMFFHQKRFAQISQLGYLPSQDLIELLHLRKEVDEWSTVSVEERAALVLKIEIEILARIDKISAEENKNRLLSDMNENYPELYSQWQRQKIENLGDSDPGLEDAEPIDSPVVQKLENKGSPCVSILSFSDPGGDSSTSSSDSDSERSSSPPQGPRVRAPGTPPRSPELESLPGIAELLSSKTAFVGHCGVNGPNKELEHSQNEELVLKL